MNIIAIAEARKIAAKPKRRTRAESRQRFMLPLPAQLPLDLAQQRGLFERHDHAVWTIRFPLAPSVNAYRTVVRNRLMTTGEGQEYHKAVKQLWMAHWIGWPPEPLTGRLRLLVSIVFGSSPPPDLDNRIKPLQDALVGAGVLLDDNQIDDLRVIRVAAIHKPGWMDVCLETID